MQIRLLQKIIGLPRPAKRLVALTFDMFLCVATVALTYYLRLGEWAIPFRTQWLSYAAAIAIAVPLFIKLGLYRAIFRYAGWGALAAVVKACFLYTVLYATAFFLIGVPGVPRTTGHHSTDSIVYCSRGIARINPLSAR